MPKRKREDDADGPAPAKKPLRNKEKYSKNIRPGSTKAERKEERRVARLQRKKAARQKRDLKKQQANGGKPVANRAGDEVTTSSEKQLNGTASLGTPPPEPALTIIETTTTTYMDHKARRKAARRAERLANKAERAKLEAQEPVVEEPTAATLEDAVIPVTHEQESEDFIPLDSSNPKYKPQAEKSAKQRRREEKQKLKQERKEKREQKAKLARKHKLEIARNAQLKAIGQTEALPTDSHENLVEHAVLKSLEPVANELSEADRKIKKNGASNIIKEGIQHDSGADEVSTKSPPADAIAPSIMQPTGYTEHPKLTALPNSEITSFLQAQQISVKNADPELRPITSFDYLPVLDAVESPFKNFSTPTSIQAATWPYMLSGRDVVGVAETGSGKTLAFGVPCIHRLMALTKKERRHIKACIVSPTRELALQIQEQLAKFSKPYGLKVTCVYGGVSKDAQREELKGTHIVVATPGRLNDFLQERSIDLSRADYLVLDEADRMLDKGFEEEVRKIASSTATDRQTLMFTATWPQSVRDLAATFMVNPVRIIIGDNATGELRANTRIVQEVEVVEPRDKQQRLLQLLKQYQSGKNKTDKILVFCLYKKEATRIEEFIRQRGFNVGGIHGDLSQQKRTESLEAFKNGSVPLLVATDVAARGLDIPAVKLVINVTFPLTAEDYVHRIGRTGRAGQDGKAITLFTEEEKGLAGALINVLKAANQPVPEELLKFGTTVKRKAHDAYGAFYKDTSEAKKATKITFD